MSRVAHNSDSVATLEPQEGVDLVLADKALTSLRASGHDYRSAVGEVFDNSLQAGANNIRLQLFTEKRVVGKNKNRTEVVERLAVGDDGDGMDANVLHHALQLGYSTRYNDRTGMGRFGVGAKLGGISQARRIELYSRQSSASPWLYTYIDLDEIHVGSMRTIPVPTIAVLPGELAHLVGPEHGTLVVWSKADRLAERDSGGARQAQTVESDLVSYTARTFRKFLDGGKNLYVNGTLVKPHDPLFQMTSTRFHEGADPDPTATVLMDETFEWPLPNDPANTAPVRVTMTLLPQKFRQRKTPTDRPGGSPEAKARRIQENEGISILRAGREIFFGYLVGVQPAIEKVDIDRWWGAEISFPPELDECFQVRNVKKGAEPVNGLRDKLHDLMFKTVRSARVQIQSSWDVEDADHQREHGVHAEAEDVAAKTRDLSPQPRAGHDTPETEREQKIQEAAEALTKDHPEKLEDVKEQIKKRPVTLVPATWPGNELFEIEHLGSTAIVRINMRHPFYKEVYAKLLAQINGGGDEHSGSSTARVAQVGLDLLILAYARAEGMHSDPADYYSDLRSYWSLHLKNMVQEWTRTK